MIKSNTMISGVVGRHMSLKRKESAQILPGSTITPAYSPRYRGRRRAVTTSDHKTCALIQTRVKLGDIM
ncbi:hypothetical protein PGB90_001875 [Kerria lacca]